MSSYAPIAGWIVFGFVAALGLIWGTSYIGLPLGRRRASPRYAVARMIAGHFQPLPLTAISISTRRFPLRMRIDLQRAIDQCLESEATIVRVTGVRKEHSRGLTLADCIDSQSHSQVVPVPLSFEDVDVGEARPARCLEHSLWLLDHGGLKSAVLLSAVEEYGRRTGMQVQVAMADTPQAQQIVQRFFMQLETGVREAKSYRGKILSLEGSEVTYPGQSVAIKVHRLRKVDRDQVILPQTTLELLDRNVLHFARQRARLAELRQSTKKGLLFYGPPGTGKTHTIHYLTGALEGYTTLLITAEQIGWLAEYMTLARLLQPSIVVIEDVDLIARTRSEMNTCEEVLLNRLLNEMDGLKEDADVFFLLTTNRPEALEQALAARPGRIDQAIEFPLPDAEGRDKLVRLYARGIELPEPLVESIVARTEQVSAAFIKELMRRAAQFFLERDGSGSIALNDVEQALDEILVSGGSLNRTLLGAAGARSSQSPGGSSTRDLAHN